MNKHESVFPITRAENIDGKVTVFTEETGITLRDYFAAKAMQGFVASIGIVATTQGPTDADIARYSYDLADAMIEARQGR